MRPFSLYVSVPTTLSANSSEQSRLRHYLAALHREVGFWASQPEWQDRKLEAVYLGGAASLLLPGEVRALLLSICSQFVTTPKLEVTLEFGGRELSEVDLGRYASAGITRLSLRASALESMQIVSLDRKSAISQLSSAVEIIQKKFGIAVNLDFVYGLTPQSSLDFREAIKDLVAVGAEHISIYPILSQYNQSRKSPTLTKVRSHQFDLSLKFTQVVTQFLECSGYLRYDLNDFAYPGFECVYSKNLLNGGDFIGVGVSAHSRFSNEFGDCIEWHNFENEEQYLSLIEHHSCGYCIRHVLAKSDFIFEYVASRLRSVTGLSLVEFKKFFGLQLEGLYPHLVEVLDQAGLAFLRGDSLVLTDRGFILFDEVIANFIPEAISDYSAKPKLAKSRNSNEVKRLWWPGQSFVPLTA